MNKFDMFGQSTILFPILYGLNDVNFILKVISIYPFVTDVDIHPPFLLISNNWHHSLPEGREQCFFFLIFVIDLQHSTILLGILAKVRIRIGWILQCPFL